MRVRLRGRHGMGYFVLIELVLFTRGRRECYETLTEVSYSRLVALIGVLLLDVLNDCFLLWFSSRFL